MQQQITSLFHFYEAVLKWSLDASHCFIFHICMSVFHIKCWSSLQDNLLKSVSMTHSLMFMHIGSHPDHAQVKVSHTHATNMVK